MDTSDLAARRREKLKCYFCSPDSVAILGSNREYLLVCGDCLAKIIKSHTDAEPDHFLREAKQATADLLKRRQISRHEATEMSEAILDRLARHYLARNPLTSEQLRKKLGISKSRAAELPAWREHQDDRKTKSVGKKANGVQKQKRQKGQVGLRPELTAARSDGDLTTEEQEEWEKVGPAMTPDEKRTIIDVFRHRLDNA